MNPSGNISRPCGYLILFILLNISASTCFTQTDKSSLNSHQPEVNSANIRLWSPEDSVKWSNIHELRLPANINHQKDPLPYQLDNSVQPFFRPLFNDVAYECGQASGVALGFTYEIDYERNVSANTFIHQYPTHFVYNFHNDGITYEGASFFDSWEIIQQLGTPNVIDYGGSLSYGGVKRWMTGYNLYYNAMHNRIYDFYMIRTKTPDGVQTLKQWLNDHCDGSDVGGVANMYTTYMSTSSMNLLPAGTEEAGKYVVTQWGGVNHGLTICGWNDSIRYDYNNDGQYTNDVDINGDGTVDVKDWEIGGVKFANTYGNPGGNTWGNSGFAYAMYKSLAMPMGSGGIWNNAVYVLKTKEQCEPVITYKITLSHSSRDNLKIIAGVSADTSASAPENIMEFTMFNYHGGNFYMQGGTNEADKTLEFGLDVTQLLNYIPDGQPARFFLLVNEKDPANDGTGTLVSYSLMDYTGTSPSEIICQQSNIPLTENGLTTASVITTVNFNDLTITTDSIPPAAVYEPYSFQLEASGGSTPYHWDFDWQYVETVSTSTFPMINAEQIVTSNSDDGWAVHNLDFTFPYYGKNYNQIVICNDGMILFSVQDFEWIYPNSQDLLFKAHEVIAPYFCDLRFYTSSGDKIWFEGDQNSAAIRWDASINGYQGTSNVNVVLKIYPSGIIEFYYGTITLPSNIPWVSGISRGDVLTWQKSAVSDTFGFAPNTKIVFDAPVFPPGMNITESGLLNGLLQQDYPPADIKFRVTDNNFLTATREFLFTTKGAVTVIDYNIESGNDSIIGYGETATMGISLLNQSETMVPDGIVSISTSDPYVTITDDSEIFGNLDTNATIVLNNAFSFDIAGNIPNEHPVDFLITVTSLQDTTSSHITVTAYAPVLNILQVIVDDGGNGILDQGETADIKVLIENSGGTTLDFLNGTFFSTDPYITINNSSFSSGSVPANGNDTLIFNLTSNISTPAGHMVTFQITGSGISNFSYNDQFGLVAGHYEEDFETGDFSLYPWTFTGNANWEISATYPYEGVFCAQSGLITHSQESSLIIVTDVIGTGEISFFRKVSCEDDPTNDNYDYLAFSIDGNELGRWDGIEDWVMVTYPVNVGVHTLKWSYIKDYSESDGLDAAWVDYISFPPVYFADILSLIMMPPDTTICQGDSVIITAFPDGGSGSYAFSWTPQTGLSDPHIADPAAFPSYSTLYTVTLSDGSENITSDLTVNVNPSPAVPVIHIESNTLVSNAFSGNQWYNEAGIINGAEDQVYIPPASGNYYVVVTNIYGCSSSSDVINFIHEGLPEIIMNPKPEIHPNPFTSVTFITVESENPALGSLEILDLTGNMILDLSSLYCNSHTGNSVTWDGNNEQGVQLPPGVYILKYHDGQRTWNCKLVKMK